MKRLLLVTTSYLTRTRARRRRVASWRILPLNWLGRMSR